MTELANSSAARSSFPQDEVSIPTWFRPMNPVREVESSARRLPHWHQPGATYFITWRLADAIPQEKLGPWKDARDRWLALHPGELTEEQRAEYRRIFAAQIETWADAGFGSCVLARPELREIVSSTLMYFDGQHFNLGDFVIMPNHVHLLVCPLGGHDLSDILRSWKGFTARAINKAARRTGTLWLDESYDHIVRDSDEYRRVVRYIRKNPEKANLSPEKFTLRILDAN